MQPGARIRPLRSLAHVDSVVIAVGVAEAQHESARHIATERVDQLLLDEAHGRGAQDDDTLFVEADDAKVGPEVEQFGQLQAVGVI